MIDHLPQTVEHLSAGAVKHLAVLLALDPGTMGKDQLDNGWRMGVAAAHRAIEGIRGSTAEACRFMIENLLQQGPPKDLGS